MNIKITLIAMTCAVCVAAAYAEPITREQAQQKAQQFVKTLPGKQTLKPVNARRMAPRQSEQESYYVFDRGSNDGYVIVSGDDQTISILGYTDQGDFDYAALPPNMQEWLDGYARQIEAIQKGAPAKKATIATHAKVEPLVTSKWSQGSPYNDACPLDDGKRSVTGCVATAMAQLLYYNREKSVTETTAAMPAYTTWTKKIQVEGIAAGAAIDWDNMKDTYSSATDLQRKAVADLMHYCGVAAKMDYTNGSSGAQSHDAFLAFAKYFGYGESVRYLSSGDGYDDAQWDQIIYNEIAARRPIYISGANSAAGHAFVCDGYDGNYCYHINWGWGGLSDGYYLLTDLTPGQQGIGGSGDGYTGYREIIIGLEPENFGDKTMSFTDAVVRKACIEHWDTDGDGKLTYNEAAAVTSLGTVFKGNTQVRKFSELYYFTGLTTLDDDAFNGCTLLEELRLPKTMTRIGSRALKDCAKLKQLTMPAGMASYGEEAFSGCKLLEEITLPSELKTIEAATFQGCAALTAIDLPISVSAIRDAAFKGCTSLTSFHVHTYQPAQTTLGEGVFEGVDLSRATLTTVQGTKDYYATAPQWSSFGQIKEKRERSGGQFAMLEAGNTYYIYHVGTGRYLTKGEAWGTQAIVSDDNPMRFKVNRTATMPDGVYYLTSPDTGKNGTYLFRTWTDTNVGSGVQAAFVDGGNLTDNAYWHIVADGDGIYTIQIPQNGINYAADKFWGVQTNHQSSAASPTYGVYSDIDYSSHSQNCQWRFVAYDESLMAIFEAANTLENLISMANKRNIDTSREQAVYDNSASTITDIRQAQSRLRQQLNIIDFASDVVRQVCLTKCDLNGDGEVSIEEAAKITDWELNLGNTAITSFDEFRYFTAIPTLYAATFQNCKQLQTVTLPDNIERIYYYAFRNCSSLSTINLGEYLNSIGVGAFQGCTALKTVTIANPDPANITLAKDVFGGIDLKACTLQVPMGAKARYAAADTWKEFGNIVEVRTAVQPRFSPITADVEGYLFNLGTRLYLTKGEAYGTQSVVARNGLVYQLRHSTGMADDVYYLEASGKVVFRTNTDSKVGEGVKACFYDGTASSKAYWKFTAIGDNIYTLQVPESDGSYVTGEYLGTDESHASGVSDGITHGIYWDIKHTGTRAQWAFVTVADLQAATKTNQLAEELAQLLTTAQQQGVDATAEQTVYDNSASTAEEMSAALVSLRKKLGFISFKDTTAKTLCLNNWDTNGDGELHQSEAAAVTDISQVFRKATNLKTFEELRYFTALTSIADSTFIDCSKLTTIYIPEQVTAMGKYAFLRCDNLKYAVILNNSQVVPRAMSYISKDATLFVPGERLADYEAEGSWNVLNHISAYTGLPSVTATATRTYGAASASIKILVDGAPIEGEPTASCDYLTDRTADAGTYPISVGTGTVTTEGATFQDGVFTIAPALLTVTAKSYQREKGQANPTFEVSYSRFQNRENASVFITQPTISCEADENSEAGEYAIVVSGAEAKNYQFNYVNGTLTVIDPTGIDTPEADTTEGTVYDLQGRRVLNQKRGIYIKGNKKIVVR